MCVPVLQHSRNHNLLRDQNSACATPEPQLLPTVLNYPLISKLNKTTKCHTNTEYIKTNNSLGLKGRLMHRPRLPACSWASQGKQQHTVHQKLKEPSGKRGQLKGLSTGHPSSCRAASPPLVSFCQSSESKEMLTACHQHLRVG